MVMIKTPKKLEKAGDKLVELATPGIGKDLTTKQKFGSLAVKMGEFAGIEALGAIVGYSTTPDVIIGYIPLFTVKDFQSAKSNKELRFRSIGGHLLAFQKADGNTCIITVRLAGPMGFFWLAALDQLYQYGLEYKSREKNRIIDMVAYQGVSGSGAGKDFAAKATKEGCSLSFQGLDVTGNTSTSDVQFNETESHAFDEVDISTAPPEEWEDVLKHRTFQIVTKAEILTKMFIESMLVMKNSDEHGQDEYQVDLLLRHYAEPPRKTYYVFNKMGSSEETSGTSEDLEKLDSEIAEREENISVGAEQLKKIMHDETKTMDYRRNAVASFNDASKKVASLKETKKQLETVHVKWFVSKDMNDKVVGTSIKKSNNHDQWLFWINQAWKMGWTAQYQSRYGNYGSVSLLVDPMIARGFSVKRTVDKVLGKTKTSTGTTTRLNPYNGTGVRTETVAENVQPEKVLQWVTEPVDVEGVIEGGASLELQPLLDEKSIIPFITGGNETKLEEVFVVVPRNKQLDLERTLLYMADIYQMDGEFDIDGGVSFSYPFDFIIEGKMHSGTITGNENFDFKLRKGNVTIPISKGLTYFLGTKEKPYWKYVGGVYKVQKVTTDELYLYFHSVEKIGNKMQIVIYMIHPSVGK